MIKCINKNYSCRGKGVLWTDHKGNSFDVREPLEAISEGYIENSKLIPLDEVPERVEKELDKSIPVLVYCRSGRRSEMAGKVLSEKVIRSMIL